MHTITNEAGEEDTKRIPAENPDDKVNKGLRQIPMALGTGPGWVSFQRVRN